MTTRDARPGLASHRAPDAPGAGRMSDSGGFPLLTIRGVRASCFVRGLHSYCLPSCPETRSKYRLRKAVRAALQGFAASLSRLPPGLNDRAATALVNARSSAEVLEARDIIIRERMRELAEDERAAREVA